MHFHGGQRCDDGRIMCFTTLCTNNENRLINVLIMAGAMAMDHSRSSSESACIH